MRIPHTIPTVAFEAFRCSEETKLLQSEQDRNLRAEDTEWDKYDVADLKTLSLVVIAKTWLDNPIDLETLPSLEDRDHLLELLPLNLPFDLAISWLPYEHYWKRAAEARWKYVDVWSHGGSWLRLYCEKHLSEHLEQVEPAYFDAGLDDEIRLLELVRPHVRTLQLRQLLPLRKKTNVEIEEDETSEEIRELEYHHLPMDVILERLPDLTEIYVNIGMIFKSDNIEWQDFEFSVEDSRRLGKGAKDLRHLDKFRLTRSSLNRARAAALLQGLAASRTLRELDFSHCKLGDEGAVAVGGYLSELHVEQRLSILKLTNNNIGAEGLAGITRGLIEGECRLGHLDLRLNPIGDDSAKHLAALLLRFASLEYLNVSGCSLAADAGMSMAEVLASGRLATSRLQLDCSNNEFGSVVGEAFEIVAKSCPQLSELDARMCGFRRESEFAISESVYRNRSKMTKRKPDKVTSELAIDDDEHRRESLKTPMEYEIYQRRRPIENLAVPSLALTIKQSSVIIGSSDEEEEQQDDEGEEEEEQVKL